MPKKFQITVNDLHNNRLCVLFDSETRQTGQIKDIQITKELNGWKEMSFQLPKKDEYGEENFRCQYLKNEHLIHLFEDDEEDIYTIKVPYINHDASSNYIQVSANHISEELKTKNLYTYFDDENGIDTCQALIEKAIAGSGWTLGEYDRFYEADGTTEKIRSYSCDTKTGAYNMVSAICDLFKARPVFDGLNKTVSIYSIDNFDGFMEINFGRNSNKVKVTKDSSNIITRLYVEGDYGDLGYVGIDSVNPTGLPFILNFGYYRDLGIFGEEEEEIVEQYQADYKDTKDAIADNTAELLEAQAEMMSLIGNYSYVYYPVVNGAIDSANKIVGDDVKEEDIALKPSDKVAVVESDGSYDYQTVSGYDISSAICVIKFIPTITGSMATLEDLLAVSNTAIETYLESINKYMRKNSYPEVTVQTLKSVYGNDLSIVNDPTYDVSGLAEQYQADTVRSYTASIGETEITITTYKTTQKSDMLQLIQLFQTIKNKKAAIESNKQDLVDIENTFCNDMGIMLRDGYWSDTNYAVGQEQTLYQDALGVSDKMAYPTVKYDVDIIDLAAFDDHREEFRLSQRVRVYDKDNVAEIVHTDATNQDHRYDIGIITKIVVYPDSLSKNNITIDMDVEHITNKTFSSILERTIDAAEKLNQNKSLYQRAVAISRDGTIHSDILEGAIDVSKSQLLSTSSGWKTDDNGNILFESLDGQNAMMLTGAGFMIANTKNDSGYWNWRTFGTGNGFTADAIVAGYLNAELIESHSITVRHLSADVGGNLDLSANHTITFNSDQLDAIARDINLSSNHTMTFNSTQLNQIATDIDLSANHTITFNAQQLEAIADNIDLTGNDTIRLNSDLLQQIADQIEIEADQINVTGQDIDLSAAGSITLNTNQLNALGEVIDISANRSLEMYIGASTSKIFRQDTQPQNGFKDGDLWVRPETGETFQAVRAEGFEAFYYDPETGVLSYSDSDALTLTLGSDGTIQGVSVAEDGTLIDVVTWERVRESEVDAMLASVSQYRDVMQIEADGVHVRAGVLDESGKVRIDSNAPNVHIRSDGFGIIVPTYQGAGGDDKYRWIATANAGALGDLKVYTAAGCVNLKARAQGEIFFEQR